MALVYDFKLIFVAINEIILFSHVVQILRIKIILGEIDE